MNNTLHNALNKALNNAPNKTLPKTIKSNQNSPLPKTLQAHAASSGLPQLVLPAGGGDSHAHLDSKKLIGQLPQILSRAKACGLSHVGQVWLHPNAYKQHAQRFDVYPEVFFTLGIHPSDAQEFSEDVLETMGIIIQEDAKVKAVGEIGLDFYWKDCPVPVQEQAFRRQLDLAKQLDKPVVIHSREAATSTLRILQAEGFYNRPLLWHCFGGDAIKILPQIVENGWYVSIPGPITFPKNAELKTAVAQVPLNQLLVETDCPYLSPQQWRGQINEPSLVTFAAEAVAMARNMDPAELWLAMGANLRRFFGLEAELS